jgi:hypothetical protein
MLAPVTGCCPPWTPPEVTPAVASTPVAGEAELAPPSPHPVSTDNTHTEPMLATIRRPVLDSKEA